MDLEKIYSKLAERNREYDRNQMYSRGKNPGILSGRLKPDPDNRVPIPLAKMAIETQAGYAAKPGNIQIDYSRVDEEQSETDYPYIIDRWQKENNDDLEVSELYVEALSQGVSYELFWISEDSDPETSVKPEWKMIPGDQIYLAKTDSLKPTTEYACYFWTADDAKYCNVYYPKYSEGYINKSGSWARYEDNDTTYPFGRVPVIEYTINYHKEPLFEAEKTIIDKHDDIVSASQNEIDRFNALMMLFPGKVTKEFIDKIKETKLIDNLEIFESDQWPKYLEKNLGGVGDFYRELTDRLERLFHKSIKVPDFTDPEFASGDESGVARAFKVLGMEYKSAIYDAYFNRGLRSRKELFDSIFALKSGYNQENYTTEIQNKRNMPIDEKAKVELGIMLKGLGVSDETIYKMLPKTIIPDWKIELERIETVEPDPLMIRDVEGEINQEPTEVATPDTVLNGAQITGALAIIEKMQMGIIDRETAVNQIMAFFQLDKATAESVIPQKKKIAVKAIPNNGGIA
jgi:SPP1 family phage portal protein